MVLCIMSQTYASHMERSTRLLADKACQLVTSHGATLTEEPFRILSIGCGDGSYDATIIQAIADQFPSLSIHYIGIDIDEQCLQKVDNEFKVLKNHGVTIETFAVDFEEVDSFKSRIPPCDLVIAAHMFYYMKDIKKALSNAQMLKKDKGMFTKILMPYMCKCSHTSKFFFFLTLYYHVSLYYYNQILPG